MVARVTVLMRDGDANASANPNKRKESNGRTPDLRMEVDGSVGRDERNTHYPLAPAATRAIVLFLPLVRLGGGIEVAIRRYHGYRCSCEVLS